MPARFWSRSTTNHSKDIKEEIKKSTRTSLRKNKRYFLLHESNLFFLCNSKIFVLDVIEELELDGDVGLRDVPKFVSNECNLDIFYFV